MDSCRSIDGSLTLVNPRGNVSYPEWAPPFAETARPSCRAGQRALAQTDRETQWVPAVMRSIAPRTRARLRLAMATGLLFYGQPNGGARQYVAVAAGPNILCFGS